MIEALLPQSQGDPMKLLRLGELALVDHDQGRAQALCAEMVAAAPSDSPVWRFADNLLSRTVPTWHFAMMQDDRRNDAYDAALCRAVTPRSRVFEIGTGAGLLAMMAARAGAREVITCEVNPVVAAAARDIIARNGFADRVRVIGKHSADVTLDDLGGPADILVSEIVDASLLGEGVLGAHEAAMRDLMKPGATVIPGYGTIRVALFEAPRIDHEELKTIAGFDVSPFNRLRRRSRSGEPANKTERRRSDSIDLFRFDFASMTQAPPAETTVECISTGGRINAIGRWIALDLDGDIRYENTPGPGPASCWPVTMHVLSEPIETVPGQRVAVHGRHNRSSVTVWAG